MRPRGSLPLSVRAPAGSNGSLCRGRHVPPISAPAPCFFNALQDPQENVAERIGVREVRRVGGVSEDEELLPRRSLNTLSVVADELERRVHVVFAG